MASFQIKTIAPPASIPATAPARVVRFQNSENSISGPKAAPKPAHAKEVMLKMVELEFQAIAIAMMVITASVMREHHMICFSVASFLMMPP